MREAVLHDLLGLPWQEAERRLRAAHIPFHMRRTRAKSRIFPLDEASLYVLRVREDDAGLEILLAPRMMKGGVRNGL